MKKRILLLVVTVLLLNVIVIARAADAPFEVHFLDVGQGDAALIMCGDATMLIDGGDISNSSLIFSYLKNCNITHLDYIVCTHAHEDHVGGLAGALSYTNVSTALCSVDTYDSKAFNNFKSLLSKQGVEITIPSAGDSFALGGATVEVLGPITNDPDNHNNSSIVLRVIYGQTSFLFMGDAEREEEKQILNANYQLGSTVLKVGHHGGETSTTYQLLREVAPLYAVVSVGKNNQYDHPSETVLSRLSDADAIVLRTDLFGNIVCVSDGGEVSFIYA